MFIEVYRGGVVFRRIFGICLRLPALLVSIVFCNHSKNCFQRSEGIIFSTCSACFVDIVSSFIFYSFFLRFLMPSGVRLAILSKIRRSRKYLKKKGSPCIKTTDHEHVRKAPREAASRAQFSNKKQHCECGMLLKLFSIAFPENARMFCLGSLELQLFQKMLDQLKEPMPKHITGDLTRPRPSPGELTN